MKQIVFRHNDRQEPLFKAVNKFFQKFGLPALHSHPYHQKADRDCMKRLKIILLGEKV